MKGPILIFFSLLLFQILSYGQNTDLISYESEKREFQEWLDEIGLGHFYNIYEITIDNDRFNVYFTSYKGNTDELIKEWDRLKNKFDPSNNYNFEKRIFNKTVTLFKVKPENVSLQFYDTYDLTQEPCFFVGIYMEDNEIKSQTTKCKSNIEGTNTVKQSEQLERGSDKLESQNTESPFDNNGIDSWILIAVLVLMISITVFLLRKKFIKKNIFNREQRQENEIPSKLKKECIELIAKGDLSTAIDNLKKHYEKSEFVEDYQHLILLENQYNSLMKDKYSNVISNEYVNIQTSKLTKGILGMLK